MKTEVISAANKGLIDIIPMSVARTRYATQFRSKQSLDWFIRQHRQELVEQGALLILAGRKHLHGPKFEDMVLAIGQRQARE